MLKVVLESGKWLCEHDLLLSKFGINWCVECVCMEERRERERERERGENETLNHHDLKFTFPDV
jgi:hypothetical protein